MRITLPLRMPQKRKWLEAYSWHRWRKQKLAENHLAAKLEKEGVKVEDANEFIRRDSPLFMDLDAIPEAQPVFPAPPKPDRNHPDWHATTRKIFDSESFPFEGIRQAQVLTRSVHIKKGLPESILELAHSDPVKDQDYLVQRIVKQAYLWDAYLDPLPKLRDLEIPQFKFSRKYGVPLKKRNETLLRNFVRLCDCKHPETALSRTLASEEEIRLSVVRHQEPLTFRLSPMLTLLSKDLLKPQHNAETTKESKLPDIYPFLSNAGIVDQNIYKEGDHFPYRDSSPFPFVHTSYFSHHIAGSHTHSHPRWNDDRFSGTSIIYNFAVAMLMARRKYGDDVNGVLPEPVLTQSVHVTGQEFQFSVFQLNNANLEEEDSKSIKNIVWLTPKMKLFTKCEYELGKEIFEGYNPEVFKNFLGLYRSGV